MSWEQIREWNNVLNDVLSAIRPLIKEDTCKIDDEIFNDGVVGIFNYETNMYVGFSFNQISETEGFGVSIYSLEDDDQLGELQSNSIVNGSIEEKIDVVKEKLKISGCI